MQHAVSTTQRIHIESHGSAMHWSLDAAARPPINLLHPEANLHWRASANAEPQKLHLARTEKGYVLGNPPQMRHTYDDQVQDKFFEALPLCRMASGSEENLDVEHRLMHAYLKKQEPDGLIYWPLQGRPWGRPKTFNAYSGMDEAPKGDHRAHLPLYQRGQYRTGQTHWQHTTRFVPKHTAPWA